MKLLSLLVLPVIASLAPTVGAQRPAEIVQRFTAVVQTETRVGMADLDAAYHLAARELVALAESGARGPVLRERYTLALDTFRGTVSHCERLIRATEDDVISLLVRLGATNMQIGRVKSIANQGIGELERHEAYLVKRLEELLGRLM